MSNINAFGASNSSRSINRQLAGWAAQQTGYHYDLLDLNDYEMPIFSIDREEDQGIPQLAHDFKNLIKNSSGIIISFAEHNGGYSAAFKNIMDWISRIEKATWDNKPMLVLATSPGGRGGKSVLDIVINTFPHRGAKIAASYSLPSFNLNFDQTKGITNQELLASMTSEIDKFKSVVEESQEAL